MHRSALMLIPMLRSRKVVAMTPQQLILRNRILRQIGILRGSINGLPDGDARAYALARLTEFKAAVAGMR